MMSIEVFNRFEHKYLIDRETYKSVIAGLEGHMQPDKYNMGLRPYTIANLYYDTPDNYLIQNSLSKPIYKEKLRLRSYGIPKMEDRVFLEIKKKYNGIVNKRRTALSLAQAYEFTKTGQPPVLAPYMNGQVIKELAYFLSFYDLSPKLYLAYDRIAYFEEGNPDLRISFDCNIRSRRYDVALEKGDYGTQLLEEGRYLMEIKTARAKPLWLTHILTDLSIQRCSFSKYGTEFRDTVTNSGVTKIAI